MPAKFLLLSSLVTGIFFLSLDQFSKSWAKAHRGQSVALAGDVTTNCRDGLTPALEMRYHENRGVAWSVGADLPPQMLVPIFLSLAIVLTLVAGAWSQLLWEKGLRLAPMGGVLVASGAIGNSLDRLRLGFVVDFISAQWCESSQRHYFPIFNVADIAIVLGIFLLAVAPMPWLLLKKA